MVFFPGDWYLSLKGFWHMHAESNGRHWVCMLSMCLLLSCTNHWGMVGGPLCKPVIWNQSIAILESPCTWDLPVHGGLEGIGLDASGFSIDTEKQKQFWKCQSVVYSDWCALTWKLNSHLNISGDMCLFVSYGHVGCQLVLVHWHW